MRTVPAGVKLMMASLEESTMAASSACVASRARTASAASSSVSASSRTSSTGIGRGMRASPPRPMALAADASAVIGPAIRRPSPKARSAPTATAASRPVARAARARRSTSSTASAGMNMATVQPLNGERAYGV